MPKSGGLGDNFFVGGYDLSGDINSLGKIGGGPATWDTTDITQSAHERVDTRRDGALEFVSYFNPDAGRAHSRFSLLPTADVISSYYQGTALGNPVASLNGKQIDYAADRGDDASFLFKVNAEGNSYGLEWGEQLTAGKRTDASATSPATGVDFTTVTTLFGWQAYLHVFSVASGTATVTLQDSADNSAFATLTGGAFTGATGITSQRLEGGRTATVRRYVRAITSGTFTNAVFAVAFTRNETAVAF